MLDQPCISSRSGGAQQHILIASPKTPHTWNVSVGGGDGFAFGSCCDSRRVRWTIAGIRHAYRSECRCVR